MSRIRYQFDEHMPHAVAHALRRHGVDALTASEAGLLSTPDIAILARSLAADRVVITHDKDYVRRHSEQVPHAGIAFCTQHARSIGELIDALLLIYEAMTPEEMAGRVEYI